MLMAISAADQTISPTIAYSLESANCCWNICSPDMKDSERLACVVAAIRTAQLDYSCNTYVPQAPALLQGSQSITIAGQFTGNNSTHNIPRFILPTMVNFSFLSIFSGHTKNHGTEPKQNRNNALYWSLRPASWLTHRSDFHQYSADHPNESRMARTRLFPFNHGSHIDGEGKHWTHNITAVIAETGRRLTKLLQTTTLCHSSRILNTML